jgi:hypothetical protein
VSTFDGYTHHAVSRLTERDLEAVKDVQRQLNGGFYDRWIRDVVFQNHFGTASLGDALAFARVYGAIQAGKVLIVRFELGFIPIGDAYLSTVRDRFVAAVSQWLPVEVSVGFGGVPQDADASIRFPDGRLVATRVENGVST